jgi:hypothetical protein
MGKRKQAQISVSLSLASVFSFDAASVSCLKIPVIDPNKDFGFLADALDFPATGDGVERGGELRAVEDTGTGGALPLLCDTGFFDDKSPVLPFSETVGVETLRFVVDVFISRAKLVSVKLA